MKQRDIEIFLTLADELHSGRAALRRLITHAQRAGDVVLRDYVPPRNYASSDLPGQQRRLGVAPRFLVLAGLLREAPGMDGQTRHRTYR
ncbi:hypothetical protein [Nonomuraea basaltis]|uniref:hypothetical protein n=1 Tax=Nonomuraea basaltis TaxID=2495887 RepID=UPI00110C666E|nr:hypothetical protein [Nonomuraea basaltis]TMR88678.1 hypothetical protein EJK15_64895 [Nonomuraea basaltis]